MAARSAAPPSAANSGGVDERDGRLDGAPASGGAASEARARLGLGARVAGEFGLDRDGPARRFEHEHVGAPAAVEGSGSLGERGPAAAQAAERLAEGGVDGPLVGARGHGRQCGARRPLAPLAPRRDPGGPPSGAPGPPPAAPAGFVS